MSLIPGVGQQNIGGPTPTPDAPYTDPAEDPTKNEYYAQRMQTPPWIQAGFPDYASYAQNLRLKEEQARALSQKQLDTNAGANSATVTATGISTAGANQRAAAQAEIDRAKNAADAAHNAGVLALEQGKADDARAQFAISSKELERYHTLDMADRQQSQQLAASKFGNDVYNKLADLASNPRNYMEQFFRMRGQTPPAGSAQYGNTSVTGPGLATFDKFLPGFLKSTGLAGGGYGYGGAPAQAASAAPAANPALSGPSGASTAGLSGFDAASGKPRLSPTDPDALGLMASHPGMYTMTSPEAAKPYIDQLKAEGNNPTTYASSYRAPQQFAGGGTLRMTAPHAIVNMLSGKVAAIAGEQRGKGPQGYVPENAKFDGKAIIEPKDGIAPYNPTPHPGDPIPVDSTAPPLVGPGPDPSLNPGSEMVGAPITTTPQQTTTTTTPPPFVLSAEQRAQLDAANQIQNAQNEATRRAQQQAQTDAANAAAQAAARAAAEAEARRIASLPSGIVPGQVTDTAPNPGPAPTPVVTPPNIPNPATSFDNLLNTPSGIGKNPSFLPEDQAATDPILKQMLQAGTFPPFLQRLFAQGRGLAGLGTNVPQATELPPGVPLVSKLAYSQMTPNERSAFESYLSAHGLDLPTYLSLVEAASPQGGTSSINPAIPKFLAQ